MKKHLYLLLTMGLAVAAQAATYSSGALTGGAIPDNNLSGVAFNLTDSGISDTKITDVKVTLNFATGGSAFNGDLYGFLAYSGGGFTVLLDRVGRNATSAYGFNTAGGTIQLSSTGSGGTIHDVMVPSSGTWYQPDGNTAYPIAPQSSFASGLAGGDFTSFNGLNPNGTWTLFLADTSGGNLNSLTSWSLDVTAVPEPITVALGIFGGLFGIVQGARFIRRRSLAQ